MPPIEGRIAVADNCGRFEVVQRQELMVRVPSPIAEVCAEMQAQVEEPTGQVGPQILRAILENEVTHRVGPPHRPSPTPAVCAGGSNWGMWSLLDKRFRWNCRGSEPAKARKWNWSATASCCRVHDVQNPGFGACSCRESNPSSSGDCPRSR